VSTVPKDYQALLLTTPRLRREQRTIEAMLNVWCEAHPLHVRTRHGKLCAGCEELFEYASYRLLKCPYGEEKPTCKKCPVHCYTRDMREQMHEVMRFAGPRMFSATPSSRSGTFSTRRGRRRPCRSPSRWARHRPA
jgi:Nitrous oxide-stimulated promoter.